MNCLKWLLPLALFFLGASVSCRQDDEVLPDARSITTTSATSAPSDSPTSASLTTKSPTATSPAVVAPATCRANEKAYHDPAARFAFCYPSGMQVTTGEGAAGSVAVTVMDPFDEPDRIVVAIGWEPQRHSVTGEACLDSEFLILNKVIRAESIAGQQVDVCYQDHYERDKADNPTELLYKTIEMEIPGQGGFISVYASYFGPNFQRDGLASDDVIKRTIESLSLQGELG